MQVFEVGKVVEEFIGHEECPLFDIDDNGAIIYVFFNSPKESEVDQFKAYKMFEIRYARRGHILMMLLKFGSLKWMDAPYNPIFSINMTAIPTVQDGLGLATTIVFVDAVTGEIKHVRVVGLSTRFTSSLLREVSDLMGIPCTREMYQSEIDNIYRNYPTTQLVKMADTYCKIQGEN